MKSFEGYGTCSSREWSGKFIAWPSSSLSMRIYSNFEIKWTVYFVFLSAKDGDQVVFHFPPATANTVACTAELLWRKVKLGLPLGKATDQCKTAAYNRKQIKKLNIHYNNNNH